MQKAYLLVYFGVTIFFLKTGVLGIFKPVNENNIYPTNFLTELPIL